MKRLAVLVTILFCVAIRAELGGADAGLTPNERLKIDELLARCDIPALKDDAVSELTTLVNRSPETLDRVFADRRADERLVGVALTRFVSDIDRRCELLGSRLSPPDESLAVRLAAVRALAAIVDPVAFFPLTDAMDDVDPRIRATAVAAIGELKDPRAFDVLLSALPDAEPIVRIAAAVALERLNDSAALDPLRRLLETEPDIGVRSRLGQAILTLSGQTPEPQPSTGEAIDDPLGELQRIGEEIGAIGLQLQDALLETKDPSAPTLRDIRARQDAASDRLSRLIEAIQQQQSQQKQQSESKKEQYERNRPPPPKPGSPQPSPSPSDSPSQRSQLPSSATAGGTPGKVGERAADWIQLDDIEKELQTEMRLESVDPRYGRLLRTYIEAIIEREK